MKAKISKFHNSDTSPLMSSMKLIIKPLIMINFQKVDYRIYSSERPGRPFNFGFSNGVAYSREILFRGRRFLNMSKRRQNTFNLPL